MFLEKRRRLIKYWPWVGGSLLAGIIALFITFFFRVPLLLNPREVISRLASGTLSKSTLETMAVLLPIVFVLVFFLLIVIMVLIFMAIANEKKYIGIIRNDEEKP